MSVESELRINRMQTRQFILARPSVIELIPMIKTRTETGGEAFADGPVRDPQRLRIIEQASAYGNSPGLLPAQDGQQRRVRYQLLGEWNATIQIDDHWTDPDGINFKVSELLPYNGYERRGQLIQYGG